MPDTKKPSPDLARQRLIGIGLMAFAFFLFSMLDTTAKWLNHFIPTPETVWSRYTFSVIFVLLVINPKTKPGVLKTKKPVIQFWRSMFLFISTILNFIALNYLQLSQTITIAFAAPLLVALLSGPFLGEYVSRDRLFAIIVGFIGVLVVARPGFGGIHPVAILSIFSVICYALYVISTRHLAAHDSTETTLVYSGTVGAILLTPLMFFIWKNPPDVYTALMMAALGIYASIGHFALIRAHRYTPAYILSPFIYTQMIWMTLFGYLIFGDVPDRFTVIGGLIVVASGLYLLLRERRQHETATAPQLETP
jgi:drug/metabolite transporter (DMT)-like permease